MPQDDSSNAGGNHKCPQAPCFHQVLGPVITKRFDHLMFCPIQPFEEYLACNIQRYSRHLYGKVASICITWKNQIKRSAFAFSQPFLEHRLNTNKLGQRPCLEWTATRVVGRTGVRYFRNVPQSRRLQVSLKWVQETGIRFGCRLLVPAFDVEPGFYKWPN